MENVRMPKQYSVEAIIDVMKAKKMSVFEGRGQSGVYRDYDLNMVGIRNTNEKSDTFDDWFVIFYRLNKEWNIHYLNCTTEPGKDELMFPSFLEAQRNGTFILESDKQFRSAWTLGYHGGGNWRHVALIQTGLVSGYRDNNRDSTINIMGQPITEGFYGINIHAASLWSILTNVGRYSAGCQVIQDPKQHQLAADLWIKSSKIWGKTFTYSILSEKLFI